MTAPPIDPAILDTITLAVGKHPAPRAGEPPVGCVMEWASVLAGEPWGDHPACTPPTIAAMLRVLNDRMPDGQRGRLVAYLPRIIGLDQSPAREQRRAYLAADRAVRRFAPLALDAAGLPKPAATLRALPPITSWVTAIAARDTADRARVAARSATRAAAYAATEATYATYAATEAAAAAAAAATEAAAAAAAATATDAAAWDDALAMVDALIVA